MVSNISFDPSTGSGQGGSGTEYTARITPTVGVTGTTIITITVDDGELSADEAFVLFVGVNGPPKFTSTPVETGAVGVAYTYDVTTADANDGDVLTITAPTLPAWLSLSEHGPSTGSGQAVTATLGGTPTVAGDYFVVLQVDDGEDQATQPFTITVSSTANQPPVADAGDEQTVSVNTSVTLDGSGSTDPDGNLPLTYNWTQSDGTAVSGGPWPVVSFTFDAPGAPAVLNFSLVVTDALGLASAPDSVVITVVEVVEYSVYLPLVLQGY